MQPLRLGMDGPEDPRIAEEQLRLNLLELMKFRRWTQGELAERIGRSQSWLSRRLSGRPWREGGSRFQLSDLDRFATVFGLSPAELLQPGYGKWDRRSGQQRRVLPDRRGRPRPGVKPRLSYKPDTPPELNDDPAPPRRPEGGGSLQA